MNAITIDDFFAKTLDNGMFGQTVRQHCICVGEVAWRIARFYEYNKIGSGELGLICALHDIGKMSPIFQYKIGNDELIRKLGYNVKYLNHYDLSVPVVCRKLADKEIGKHSGAGVCYLNAFINTPNARCLKMFLSRHHGFSAFGNNLDTRGRPGNEIYCGDESDMKNLVLELVNRLEQQFNFKIGDINKVNGIDLDIVSGYLSIADWIASSELASVNDISTIDFDAILVKYGFHKMQVFEKTYHEMFGFDLYDYQKEVVNKINDYGFHILEMGTGNGKTEIALATAYKFIKSGKCNGMYFALPTQVTSNKIFERVDKFVGEISNEPSTELVHSNRMQALFEMGRVGYQDKDDYSFFNSNKNLRLLNNVVTGTVDQLLYSILNSKYNFIRVASLWHKIIIIDEVHCYDSFTTELIRKLKECCLECECVVIALSATVSDTLKEKLFGKKETFLKDYPLLSMTNNGVFQQVPVTSTSKPKKFHVLIEKNEDKAILQAIADAKAGRQILWLENTVAKAQNIYKKIAGLCVGSGIELGLLHSHFTQHDRLKNEAYWIGILGKKAFADGTRANCGRILVATQVAEQSLDIDVDKLYTRLCPIDAFGQRLGRVGRFGRSVNEFDVVVLSEHSCHDYMEHDNLKWFFHADAKEYSAFIYPRIVLYKTLEYLESHMVIEYPSDYREQLNYVYDNMVEINGFDKYNDFMTNFFEDEKNSIKSAGWIEARHGFTNRMEDVKTRQIVDNGSSTLLVRSVNGNKYTLLSGCVLDMGKTHLSLEDKIRIDENTIPIEVRDKVGVDEKHKDFENIYSVEMTAKINPMGHVEFFNKSDLSPSGYSYDDKMGLIKLK